MKTPKAAYSLYFYFTLFFAFAMPFFGSMSKSFALSETNQYVDSALRKAGVEFEIIPGGWGFRIKDFGTHQLNKMAERLMKTYKVDLVFRTRSSFKNDGIFDLAKQSIRIRAGKHNIDDLVGWDSSIPKSIVLHEIRHVYLFKEFDHKGIITPLSMWLEDKKPDFFTESMNLYHKFLNFQEFSTYARDLQILLQEREFTQKTRDYMFGTSLVYERFSYATLKALDFFIRNISNPEIQLRKYIFNEGGVPIRFLKISSDRWNLYLMLEEDEDIAELKNNRMELKSKIRQTKNLVSEIFSLSFRIRNRLKTEYENEYPSDLLKAYVSELNTISSSAYSNKIGSTFLRCSHLFGK